MSYVLNNALNNDVVAFAACVAMHIAAYVLIIVALSLIAFLISAEHLLQFDTHHLFLGSNSGFFFAVLAAT